MVGEQELNGESAHPQEAAAAAVRHWRPRLLRLLRLLGLQTGLLAGAALAGIGSGRAWPPPDRRVMAGCAVGAFLVDNALIDLGRLYEDMLKDPEKAKTYYEKLLFEQTGSIFVPEARDRYRKLRGDKLEGPPEPERPTQTGTP